MTITDNEISTIKALIAQLEARIASLPFRPECRGRTVYDLDLRKFKGMKYVPYLTGAEIMQFNRDNRRKHLGMFWTWRWWQYLAVNPYLWIDFKEIDL
jgi:hypothetical protein